MASEPLIELCVDGRPVMWVREVVPGADVECVTDGSGHYEWHQGGVRLATWVEPAAAVVSVHQPLVDRAEELARKAAGDVSSCRERGQHPRWSPASTQVVAELAELVRDLAKAVAGR
jgi:hypothetical protein